MRAANRITWGPRATTLILSTVVLCVIVAVQKLPAQSTEEFDSYKVRLEGFWVYSTTSGTFQGSSANSGSIDVEKDLHFNTYSTGFGKLDWKFTHKNHLYVFGTRLTSAHE